MATETNPIRWGIIGAGGIAKAFLLGLNGSRTGKLVAIGSRNPAKPSLKADFPGARIHDGYEALLADPEVDAVYIATPHPGHAEWAIKAAEAGKHALVEKPIGLSAFEAEAMYDAARKAGTFMGEAFMYRLHPQTQQLIDLVKSGAIGEVRMIKSSFGFAMPKFMPEHRLYANDLGGGGILDVGGYPASMVRLIAGAATGKPFADPVKVLGVAHLGLEGTDEWASAVLKFDSGIIAEISCSVSVQQENVLRILGTTGRIEVKDFWFVSGPRDGQPGTFEIIMRDGSKQTVGGDKRAPLYSFEADAVGDAIRAGRQEFAAPGMSWADSLGNLRVLDKWRADAGLEFNLEKPQKKAVTIRGDKLKAPKRDGIEKREIRGLSQPTSLVAMGFEYFPTFKGASILLDAFYERGGNLFDTAHGYRSGQSEGFFGNWHKSRGVKRDSFVLIGKGIHTPLNYPDQIGKQLTQSLERLKTDYVDVYFMHRDNEEVPVGEFVDALNAELKAGRIKDIYGGSNWSRKRMDQAINYANKHGLVSPGGLSNNFALAEMVKPVWAGCVAASDDEWKAWLKRKKIPDFSWSSQARGFFTDAAGRDKFDNPEIVNSWYSPKNFKRRDRAIKLAQELGKTPIQIALAYVLNQPLEVVPLIGPRSIAELENSLEATAIKLSKEQVKWLEG
ncbi:MAG: oxidoreductase [Hyphomicrobiales bacterium]|nr:MAG: oxidoreductase [Hyphomicrobiales bacterium]